MTATEERDRHFCKGWWLPLPWVPSPLILQDEVKDQKLVKRPLAGKVIAQPGRQGTGRQAGKGQEGGGCKEHKVTLTGI